MGSVIRREVVAVRCELRSCHRVQAISPQPVGEVTALDNQLFMLVQSGWGFVLTPQMRSYCPEHRERVWGCTCRTNPDRRHLCTVHSSHAAALVRCEIAAQSNRPIAA